MKITEFIKTHHLHKKYKELIFFGGSFNPWHSGHTSCLMLMDPKKLILVMPDHNPFKDVTAKEDRFSTMEDLKTELAMRKENTFLYTGFLEDDHHNPTHNWLKQVKDAFPKNELSLLMGFDSFMSLDKWIEANEILHTLTSIYVASRLDSRQAKESQFHLLKSITPKLEVNFIGRHPFEYLSSTQLRSQDK